MKITNVFKIFCAIINGTNVIIDNKLYPLKRIGVHKLKTIDINQLRFIEQNRFKNTKWSKKLAHTHIVWVIPKNGNETSTSWWRLEGRPPTLLEDGYINIYKGTSEVPFKTYKVKGGSCG